MRDVLRPADLHEHLETTARWKLNPWRLLKLWQLNGSFSAVSKPIFASKYSFESSWRDLQDLHAFAPLSIKKISQISSNFFALLQFYFQSWFFCDSGPTFTNFHDFFRNFSNLHGEDQNFLIIILKFLGLSQRVFLKISENDFRRVRKKLEKIEMEKSVLTRS